MLTSHLIAAVLTALILVLVSASATGPTTPKFSSYPRTAFA